MPAVGCFCNFIKMFQCPLCCRNGFSTHEAVARHMSQPRSGCSTWIEEVIRLKTIIQPSEDDPINVNQESFVHDDYYSASYDDTNIQAAGGLFEEEHVPASHNEFLDLFPGSAEVYEGGYMFLGLFDADENSAHRVHNPYYLFSGRKEWEVASWLLRSGLSMGKINLFLSLEMVSSALAHLPL